MWVRMAGDEPCTPGRHPSSLRARRHMRPAVRPPARHAAHLAAVAWARGSDAPAAVQSPPPPAHTPVPVATMLLASSPLPCPPPIMPHAQTSPSAFPFPGLPQAALEAHTAIRLQELRDRQGQGQGQAVVIPRFGTGIGSGERSQRVGSGSQARGQGEGC